MPTDETHHPESSLSSHRLPTISASQALQKLQDSGSNHVSTGLPHLDSSLSPSTILSIDPNFHVGGYPKGQITEIYGPPAAGKTALGLQACLEVLRQGHHVAWIDAGDPLHASRLSSLPPDLLSGFHHYIVPTLPHLLSLIIHPPASFPSRNTSLLIIDNLATLFISTYPDHNLQSSFRKDSTKSQSQAAHWRANRRYAVMAEFMAKLTRLATIHEFAAVLISGTSIKVRSGISGAMLRPMIWTKSWSDGVRNQIVVLRDFWRSRERLDEGRKKGLRYVGVVKKEGVSRQRLMDVVCFRIEDDGCREIGSDSIAPGTAQIAVVPVTAPSPLKKTKRKRLEVADSQSEDEEEDLLSSADHGAGIEDHDVERLHVSFDLGEYDDEDLAGLDEGLDED